MTDDLSPTGPVLVGAGHARRSPSDDLASLSVLIERVGRAGDLDEVITVALDSLSSLLGFDHSVLMMVDETGERLYTIASRGYDRAGIGSEVAVGVGVLGMVASRQRPMRVLNLQRMLAYARSAQPAEPATDPAREVSLPALPSAQSQLAAPALVMGQLLGVLAVESHELGAFNAQDEIMLGVVAHLLASAIELDRVNARATVDEPEASEATAPSPSQDRPADADLPRVAVRFFPVDGSTFVDGEYLIKGVPGRILWRLLRDFVDRDRVDFTNREVRLDPSLELPAYRDNLESRLILLKRRLDERQAPMRIEKTGRGRFRLLVEGNLVLEHADDDS